jgi:hypothetical protein
MQTPAGKTSAEATSRSTKAARHQGTKAANHPRLPIGTTLLLLLLTIQLY